MYNEIHHKKERKKDDEESLRMEQGGRGGSLGGYGTSSVLF